MLVMIITAQLNCLYYINKLLQLTAPIIVPEVIRNEDIDGDRCAICIDTKIELEFITLPCGHEFHKDCLQSLKICPLCRAPRGNI